MAPGDAEDGVVAPEEVECSDPVHKALQYLDSLTFSAQYSLVEKSQLYK